MPIEEERKLEGNDSLSQGGEGAVTNEVMAPRTFIPIDKTNEIIQLKGVWQQAIKDFAY
jgi:hypothetical protein